MKTTQPTFIGVVPLMLELFLNNIQNEIAKKNKVSQIAINLLWHLSDKIRRWTSWNVGFYLFGSVQKAFGGNLTRIVSGAAALKPEVLSKLQGFGFNILEAYGLTETTGPVSSNFLKKSKKGSVGKVFNEMHIRIAEPDKNGEGEICIKGPLVMKGYFLDDLATQQAIQEEWLHTGDSGFIDSDGFLTITGRLKEIIVLPSGKKAIPASIEEQYLHIEGVASLAVFGKATKGKSGEKICASVELEQHLKNMIINNPEKLDKIQHQIEKNIYNRGNELPFSLQIQHVYIVDEILRTSMMKVKRSILQTLIEKKYPNDVKQPRDNRINTITLQNDIKKENFLLKFKDLVSTEKQNLLCSIIRETICNILNLNPIQIDDSVDFHQIGMDSLIMLEFKNTLEMIFGIKILGQLNSIFDYRNIKSLACHIEEIIQSIPDEELESFSFQDSSQQEVLATHEIDDIQRHVNSLLCPSLWIRATRKLLSWLNIIFSKYYFKLTVKGLENLPKNQSFILCANHASFLDNFMLPISVRKHKNKVVGLVGDSYLKKLKFLPCLGATLPFDRNFNDIALHKNLQYIQLSKRIGGHKIFIIFPEGTRSTDGKLQTFKNAIAWLSDQADLDIVPAYIEGTYELMPKGSFWFKPGRITITFGKPLSIRSEKAKFLNEEPQITYKFYKKFTQDLQSSIIALTKTD